MSDDVTIQFSQPMPSGYHVVWSSDHEMYFGVREVDDHWDGIYCDRFMARRWCLRGAKRNVVAPIVSESQ